MRWLEIVRLRSASGSEDVLKELLDRIVSLSRDNGIGEMRIYRHGEIENDTSIHIFRESPWCDCKRSAIANQIADALKEFGLIDHSIWIEQNGEDRVRQSR
jgi:hypothetical protein